ncbi:stage 0 sporulation protein [bacterium]|nr:stage 0 sporulation protein [bacterium]
MKNIFGVKLQYEAKVWYFENNSDIPLKIKDDVVVKTSRGLEFGFVKFIKEISEEKSEFEISGNIVRKATEKDVEMEEKRREEEIKGVDACQKEIISLELVMKLLKVYSVHDRSKIIFYFTAPGKVDFRTLVRRLASVFKTRIEMRQIGVRDEVEMVGGIGVCGRPTCCSTFLSDFESIGIKVAKCQNISLNPTKISGICGRLMCCLKYEAKFYEKEGKKYPPLGAKIHYCDEDCIVIDINILSKNLSLLVKGRGIKKYTLEEFDEHTYKVLALREDNDRKGKKGKSDRKDKSDKQGKPDRKDKSDKQGKPDRKDKNDRKVKPDRKDKNDRQGRPDRKDKKNKQNRPDRKDRKDKQNRPDRKNMKDKENKSVRQENKDKQNKKNDNDRSGE